jgi:hypothetical protein
MREGGCSESIKIAIRTKKTGRRDMIKTAREQRRKCSGTGSGRSGQSSNRRIAREKGGKEGRGCRRKMVIKYVQRKPRRGGFALI